MSKTKKQKMELLYRICKALSPLYGELVNHNTNE
jgi:hypothetical protein